MSTASQSRNNEQDYYDKDGYHDHQGGLDTINMTMYNGKDTMVKKV